MTAPERIKSRRESLGLDLKAVAAALRMNEPSYWDVESFEDELIDVADFSQAIQLAGMLGTKLLALLGEEFDYASGGRLSFEALRDLILRKDCSRSRLRLAGGGRKL